MRLEGIVYQGDRRLGMQIVEIEEVSESFSKNLDTALLRLCKDLQLPIPIWMRKNTREFARYHTTQFFPEQFTEEVYFSAFQIKLLEK